MTAWILAAARTQAVVLAFEDLHWADPTSLDLLRALADRGAQAPLLLLATTRPEFRPPWSLRSHHSLISLSPLDHAGVVRMVGEISASRALPKEVIEGVSERTGGVPLFVEEVTRLLVERAEQGGVEAIPPTLRQSLAARLDRLGAAREVAQIGAVLGRDFAYRLLRDVAEADEPELQASLERLGDADLLFVEGAPPQANYRFKHALIQDAAYDSLLKSRRQALHRRAAEALREANAEPEAIAHHFTQAGLDDLAIEWWGKAGDQALRRSAFQEAIAHLGKAIAMADRGPVGSVATVPERRRLKLQTDYAQALVWSKGFAADETRAAFERTGDLATGAEPPAERFPALFGQYLWSLLHGDIRSARQIAGRFLQEAEVQGRLAETGVGHRIVGLTSAFLGNLVEARRHLEVALRTYDRERDSEVKERFALDTGVAARVYLALASWLAGDLQRASQLIEEAMGLGGDLGHLPDVIHALWYKVYIQCLRNDPESVAVDAGHLLRTSQQHGVELFVILADMALSWARGRLGDTCSGANELRRSLAEYTSKGNRLFVPPVLALLAELESAAGDAERAQSAIDEGLAMAQEGGQHYADSFLHRLHGDLLLKLSPDNAEPAATAYKTAVEVSEHQGARTYKLLASLSLAKLYQSTSRPADAHAVLAPALEGFSPTPEMPEIAEAQALLTALAATDEVKADAARRYQLTQLHVSYGNALLQARGYGAPETTEAFARARESASGDKNSPERLAADYGLWVGGFWRADLPSMRAHAAAFLSDIEARPDSPEASVAHRAAGITCWFAGEYREARDHFERALALFQPGRDDDLGFRFGLDPGVAAMAYLAIASWPLGEVDQAISLIDRMQTRMSNLTHVGTLASGRMLAALFELIRRDHARAAPNAFELARLAREHDLNLWRTFSVFLEGLAIGATGTIGGWLEDMRRGAELLREQNVLIFDGLLKIALAEAEDRAGDPARAIAILNEALATCNRMGHRAFEAELHRTRGEILLKRDAATSAPAEGAFLTAIAVAKQQGTRSFELRAALSLAKLYLTIGRPFDAHAILAPALEGFAPTPEMPEIAEAQSLLAVLAESDAVKAEAAQRQRLTQLQIAYGNALFAARGYGARETTEAFAKARESASGDKDAPERLAADYGLWAGSLVRGELPLTRTHAAALLNDCEARLESPEAGVAHRAAGITCWFAGEYCEARDHLERALAMFQPGRDDELAFRLGVDPGTAAMAYLAITSWPLGEVDRARSLIERMQMRIAEFTHAGMLAYGKMHAALFEMMRGDPGRAAPIAFELVRLADEHDLPMFRAFGMLLQGWAEGQSGSFVAGLEDMRRGVNLAREQNVLVFDGLFKTALAEAEARVGDPGRGIAILDEALATHDRIGYRAFEAEQHRARGELLIKRDPSDTGSAEEALKRAVEVARVQQTRSFGLRAALSLAKLYRPTGRFAEAHAVLALALEGFSPTPEMPEIGEAQALLESLLDGAEGSIFQQGRTTKN
jgi:predicted ATPase